MKQIIAILLAFLSLNCYAEVVRENNTFKSITTTTKATETPYTWEDKEGNKYPVFITKKGACYVIKTSKKTGKEYKYYLPKEVQEIIKKELNINETVK